VIWCLPGELALAGLVVPDLVQAPGR
jgi:hypothetical protein